MKIKGQLVSENQNFEYIIIKTSSGTEYIKWEDEDISFDGLQFLIKSAFFLGDVDEEYDSEVRCLYDIIQNIVEDPETGVEFEWISFEDNEGIVTCTLIENESSMNKEIKIEVQWNETRNDKTESIQESEETTEITSQKEDDKNKNDDILKNATFAFRTVDSIEEAKKDHNAVLKIDDVIEKYVFSKDEKLMESPSSRQKLEKVFSQRVLNIQKEYRHHKEYDRILKLENEKMHEALEKSAIEYYYANDNDPLTGILNVKDDTNKQNALDAYHNVLKENADELYYAEDHNPMTGKHITQQDINDQAQNKEKHHKKHRHHKHEHDDAAL